LGILTLKMESIRLPETSVTNKPTLSNNPEEPKISRLILITVLL